MKWIFSVCVFLLMLGVAVAQPTNAFDDLIPKATNSVAGDTFEQTKAKAENGDVKAQAALGTYYFSVTNYVDAVKWVQKAAEQGNALAQVTLGYAYYGGVGVPKNYAEAARWYRKAAEQGNMMGQIMIADCYQDGIGVIKDEGEAAEWYRKAGENKDTTAAISLAKIRAEEGNPDSQMALGLIYYLGHGVPQDYAEAVKWLQKSAAKGNATAQLYLGRCYLNGNGVEKDVDVAGKWIRKASEQGEEEAQTLLGMAYAQSLLGASFDGLGFQQDYKLAVKWFARAANQGNAFAQSALGVCYQDGQGVPKNRIEAYKWLNLAAAQSSPGSADLRDSLGRKMTTEEIARSEQLAAAFVPKKEKLDSTSANSSPENPTASGTGFFITDDGYLISNYHVVKAVTKVRLVTSAGTVDAKVVQVDAANDLALLKAVGKFSPLPIAASRLAHLGGTVATIGFPDPSLQGFSPKLAKGEIASLSGAGDDPRYFQISVPVQPGNSGGALVDERGNVIGIVSAKLDARVALAASGALPENVNYAVKSSLLLSFLESAPEVASKLKEPNTKDESFQDVVKSAQDAAVLVLVY